MIRRAGYRADIRDYWHDWMDQDGHPFWENVRIWWQYRHLPNYLLVHFNNLKHDMSAETAAPRCSFIRGEWALEGRVERGGIGRI